MSARSTVSCTGRVASTFNKAGWLLWPQMVMFAVSNLSYITQYMRSYKDWYKLGLFDYSFGVFDYSFV